MLWLVELARLISLAICSASAVAIAVWVAHLLRLHRLWTPLVRGPASPESVVAELVQLAETCKQDGLLAIEAPANASSLPLLRHGVTLAISGSSPDQVRAALDDDLERFLGRRRVGRATVAIAVAAVIGIAIPIALGVQFLAGVIAASGSAPVWATALLVAAFPALAILVCAAALVQTSSQPAAARAMIGMLVIEGLCLITKGAKPDAVRAHLARLLPPARETGESGALAA